jgi:hypothetical protein
MTRSGVIARPRWMDKPGPRGPVEASLSTRSGLDSPRFPGCRVGRPTRRALGSAEPAAVAPLPPRDGPRRRPAGDHPFALVVPSHGTPLFPAALHTMGYAKRDPPRAAGVPQRDQPCLTAGLDEIRAARSRRRHRQELPEISERLQYLVRFLVCSFSEIQDRIASNHPIQEDGELVGPPGERAGSGFAYSR